MELKYYFTILSHIGAVIGMDRKGASETGNILDSLLSNYDKRFRPGYNRNTTQVRVSMDVEYLEVDEVQKTCTMYFLFRLKWTDERLRLGPDATHISIHDQNLIDKFWKPTVFFIEAKSVKQIGNSFFKIDPYADQVIYAVTYEAMLHTSFQYRHYPFDKQVCNLTMDAGGFANWDVHIKWEYYPVYIHDVIHPASFEITSHNTLSYLTNYSDGSYDNLKLSIELERKWQNDFIVIYPPAICTVFLAWLGFWIDSKESITRAIFALLPALALIGVFLSLHMTMPLEGTAVTNASLFLTLCGFYSFVAIVELLFVSFFNERNRKRRAELEEVKNEETDGDILFEVGSTKADKIDWAFIIGYPMSFCFWMMVHYMSL